MKPYWMVHRPGTSSTYMHETRGKAIDEAKRLHRNTGQVFVVLEAVGTVGEGDELPKLDDDKPF